MYLYHGSDVEVATISFDKSRDVADFGKGFYTTNNLDQAVRWAKRKAIEHMGSKYNPDIKGVITVFDFNTALFHNSGLKCKRFRGISSAWVSFLKNNIKNGNAPEGDHNLDLRYDLVAGPAATLDIYVLSAQYENGQIDKAGFKAALKTIIKCNQYSFHTPESGKYLKLIGHEHYDITETEFDNFHDTGNCYIITSYAFNEQKGINQLKMPIKLINH